MGQTPAGTKQRRSPEQQLAAAKLQMRRAKSKIRNREKQRQTAKQLLTGRLLLEAAAGDPATQRFVLSLASRLKAAHDRALFDLPPLADVGELERAIEHHAAALTRARNAGDSVEADVESQLTIDAIVAWELATGKLHRYRPRSWEPVPGNRPIAANAA